MTTNIASRLATKFHGTVLLNYTTKRNEVTHGVLLNASAFKEYLSINPTKYHREKRNTAYIVF